MFHYYVQVPYQDSLFEVITSVPLVRGDIVAVGDYAKGIDDHYKVAKIVHQASRNQSNPYGFISNQAYVKLKKIKR